MARTAGHIPRRLNYYVKPSLLLLAPAESLHPIGLRLWQVHACVGKIRTQLSMLCINQDMQTITSYSKASNTLIE